ncbi:SDR family oxidoreductase [Streptomyces sp. MW-W600-10]|nr:SDR family oxidoreductase [Streptomyces sp. MW-W600-10]
MSREPRTPPPTTRVLITGAGRGFGLALAEEFVRSGIRVAVNSRNPQRLARAADHLRRMGGTILELPGDAADAATVRAALDTAADTWDGLDCVIDNAGVAGPAGPLWSTPTEEWWEGFSVNLRTTHSTLAAAPAVLRASGGGRLLHISSAAGIHGWPYASAYAAAKAAGINLCHTLHRELAHDPIAVFAFHPGIITTGLTATALLDKGSPDRWRRLHASWFAQQISQGHATPPHPRDPLRTRARHRSARRPQRPVRHHHRPRFRSAGTALSHAQGPYAANTLHYEASCGMRRGLCVPCAARGRSGAFDSGSESTYDETSSECSGHADHSAGAGDHSGHPLRGGHPRGCHDQSREALRAGHGQRGAELPPNLHRGDRGRLRR